MRMWNVDPSKMCRKHLMGEHVELHMMVGSLKRGKSIKGFLEYGLIEVHNIEKRHQELVIEMTKRGYNHKSPLKFPYTETLGKVDIKKSEADLRSRCSECKF